MHVDLANRSSCVAIQTEDLGVQFDEGLVLIGREQGASLRGCSLDAEELRAPMTALAANSGATHRGGDCGCGRTLERCRFSTARAAAGSNRRTHRLYPAGRRVRLGPALLLDHASFARSKRSKTNSARSMRSTASWNAAIRCALTRRRSGGSASSRAARRSASRSCRPFLRSAQSATWSSKIAKTSLCERFSTRSPRNWTNFAPLRPPRRGIDDEAAVDLASFDAVVAFGNDERLRHCAGDSYRRRVSFRSDRKQVGLCGTRCVERAARKRNRRRRGARPRAL